MKKNPKLKKLKNVYFYLKYYSSNKLQYFKQKIQADTLKMWHFKDKINTVAYVPKKVFQWGRIDPTVHAQS